MARINRTDVIQKAVNDLALSLSADKVPTETLDKVQLTYSLNKQFSNFVVRAGATASGTNTVTLPSIDSRSDIYVTALDFSIIKDATCDVPTSNLTLSGTPEGSGISTNLLSIPVITLTAQSERVTITLPFPLKIKPNTNMTFTGTFTVGVMVRSATIYGFTTSSN